MVYSEDWSSSNNIAYRKRIAYLADYVNSHSVTLTFDKLHDINVNFARAALVIIVNNWCREYIGDETNTPDITEGYIDYDDGMWAVEIVNDGYSYWFARKQDMALFKLRWL